MVLISVAGFPGLRNFDPLRFTFERIAEVGGDELAGAILFPASPLLMLEPSPAAEQLDYVVHAGREILEGPISAETAAGYSKPYVDEAAYIAMVNQMLERLVSAATANPG